MRKIALGLIIIMCLQLACPVSAANNQGLEWGISTGTELRYSVTTSTVSYILVVEITSLSVIPDSVTSTSQYGYDATFSFDNGTDFWVGSILFWGSLGPVVPTGNWDVIATIVESPNATISQTSTRFTYDYSGFESSARYYKSDGTLERYEAGSGEDSWSLVRIAEPMNLALPVGTLLAGGGIFAVLLIGVVLIKKRKKPDDIRIGEMKAQIEELPQEVEDIAVPEVLVDEAPPTPSEVQVFRGCTVIGGKFEYKVKIVNGTDSVITDIMVIISSWPDEFLEISGPKTQTIKRIGVGEFRSPQFIFLPTKNCVEGRIRATVTYLDHQDNAYTLQVEPYMIRSVCDLLEPIESTMQQFELILSDMELRSEEHVIDWSPEVLFSKVKKFLPSCNFHLVEASGDTVGGIFTGRIKGLAEGKHNKKKIATRITISGQEKGDSSRVVVEGLGEDLSMIPTALYELSQGISSWTCMNCGGALEPDEVSQIKLGVPVRCRFCEHTMTMDLYRK